MAEFGNNPPLNPDVNQLSRKAIVPESLRWGELCRFTRLIYEITNVYQCRLSGLGTVCHVRGLPYIITRFSFKKL
jgi:hypothetical protein